MSRSAACSWRPAPALRRPSLTQSSIFLPSDAAIMPWPHMVVSMSTCESGSFSVLPSKPSER